MNTPMFHLNGRGFQKYTFLCDLSLGMIERPVRLRESSKSSVAVGATRLEQRGGWVVRDFTNIQSASLSKIPTDIEET